MSDVLADRQARADSFDRYRTLRRALAVVFFAVLTGVGAALEVRLPGNPVPVTLQTLFVSLSGVLLGARLGAMSQALYLAAGAMGAPVFAGGALGLPYLFGPTGGYLLAFPLAAAVTGWMAGKPARPWTAPHAMRLWFAILIGTAVIFAGGVTQLTLLTGDSERAFALGLLPFIVGDLLKVTVALLLGLRYRARTLGWL
jgi:biotin transport system substrate-specific component